MFISSPTPALSFATRFLSPTLHAECAAWSGTTTSTISNASKRDAKDGGETTNKPQLAGRSERRAERAGNAIHASPSQLGTRTTNPSRQSAIPNSTLGNSGILPVTSLVPIPVENSIANPHCNAPGLPTTEDTLIRDRLIIPIWSKWATASRCPRKNSSIESGIGRDRLKASKKRHLTEWNHGSFGIRDRRR